MKQETLSKILEIIDANVWSKSLVKLRISGPRNEGLLYNDITIKLIDLNAGTKLQFLYKYSDKVITKNYNCLLYTSPSPRDATLSRMPSSA